VDKFDLEVISILRQLDIPAHVKGYEYIKTAMNVIKTNPKAIHGVIKLYETVAEREGVTASKVERGIRHALETIESSFLTQKKLLGTDRKLTNGEFLATLAEVIRVKLAGVA